MSASGYIHGGDLERAAREAGVSAADILDFSANINPAGLPPAAAERLAREARDPQLLLKYPPPGAPELRNALSRRLDVAADCVVIGAGAEALIHAAVRALQPERCLIPVPAFCEYERAAAGAGCSAQRLPLEIGAGVHPGLFAAAGSGDLAVLNNPHNPTGACAPRAAMLDCIEALRSRGAAVLVDEAFIDYAPEDAITRHAAARDAVIAIRSLTKFYGCPGLRVGYAVAAPETARKLAARTPAWPVTTLALSAVTEALCDEDYDRQTRERNACARAWLSSALSKSGCRVYPPAANFLFLRLPDRCEAAGVRARLLREHRILVRECDSFAGLEPGCYLRVAVRFASDNARLAEALASVLR